MALVGICKMLMVILNILFLIISLAFTAIGVVLVFMVDMFLKNAFDSAKSAAGTSGYTIEGEASDLKDFPILYELGVAFLAFGVVLFVLSLIGCCGSCCSQCCRIMLLVFAVIMFVMVVAEIAVFSLFLVKDSALHKKLKDEVQSKITSDYDENSGNTFTATIIIINREGDCCGMEGVADFGTKSHLSCEAANENTGCYDKMQDLLQDNDVYAGLAVAGILALQVLEIICAIVIYKDEKSKIFPI
ncbi:hypothetical protein EGW08_016050 [Elysia chlorotica]|uniref:Tetraspanin n=1 Tax=Elysia chlorotica TaxID=188477 RepID=A0A3S0ZD69_ELYCH|nr:hypothetical protein EGW08_016050 [Elysia chlorotica]